MLEQRDHAVFSVPVTVARAPDFVGVDFAAAGEKDQWFAAAPGSHARTARGNWIDAGARVRRGDARG